MAETIKVDWITTQTQILQAFDKLNAKIDKSGQASKKAGAESAKASQMAAGSFAKLEKELRDNEKQLKQLTMGSKAFGAQKAKVDALRKSYDRAKQGLASHNKQASRLGAIGASGMQAIGGMVAGLASFHAIVSGIVADLQKAENIKLQSAETERTLEQSLLDLGQNGVDMEVARDVITQNAPDLGVTQQGLAMLLGEAISGGAKDLTEAMKIASTTLQTTGGDAERARALVGGTLDVASAEGSDDFAGALGQLMQVQTQVRSTNLSEFASNIGPALAAATAGGQNVEGQTTEQAFELAAVISQILKDQTGANTATAVRQFVTRLDSFVPQLQTTLKDGSVAEVSKDEITRFREAKTFEERVGLMRENEALGLQFLDKQKEGIGKTAIREIVMGTERARNLETRSQAAISDFSGGGETLAGFLEQANKVTAVLQAQRRSAAHIEAFETTGRRAIDGQIIDNLNNTIAKLDLPGVDAIQEKALSADLKLASDSGDAGAVGDVAVRTLQGLLNDDFSGFGKRTLDSEEKNQVRKQLHEIQQLISVTKEGQSRQEEIGQRQLEILDRMDQRAARPPRVKISVEGDSKVRPVPSAVIP